MQTYIALLRGINVSGKKIIKMEALRQMCMDCGFKEVQTYIQSGNIVFRSSEKNSQALEKILKQSIQKNVGFEVPVMVLEHSYLKECFQNNPFARDTNKNPDFFHVQIMAAQPDAELMQKIDKNIFLPDTFEIIGRCIYLYLPGGYGNTKLNTNFFENKLKLSGTTRNWKTMSVLVEMGM